MKKIIMLAAMGAATLGAGSALANGDCRGGTFQDGGNCNSVTDNRVTNQGGAGGTGIGVGFAKAGAEASAKQGQLQGQLQGQSADNAGNAQSLSLQQSYSADPGRNNTPSIGMGSLYPSSPCMGTSNIGGSGPGFSVGFGTSWVDEECQKMEASRNAPTPADKVHVWCKSKFAEGSPSCPKAAAPAKTADATESRQAPKPKTTDARPTTTASVQQPNNCVSDEYVSRRTGSPLCK